MDRDATQPNGREPARPDDDDPQARIDALRREGDFGVVDIPNKRDWLERAEQEGFKAGLDGTDRDAALARIATEAARRDPELERRAADPDDPLHSFRDLIMQRPDPAKLAEAFAKGYREGQAEKRGKAPSRPALVWSDDIVLDLDQPGVVDGHMPRTGLGVSYGESGSGKTFVVLDRACHVAAGLPWRGMPVEQGIVVYIAAESPESVKRRVWAWKRHHGVERLPLVIVQASVDMLNGSTAELVELVERITRERGRVAMVVVDTLARAMIGNENSPDDMGAFIAACGQLRDAGDTFVVIVHHCGKNAALGARGHSSLRGATDFEEEISLTDDGEGSIKTTKVRDDERGSVMGFRLDKFELGTNARGRMVTTCVVRAAEPPAKAPPKAGAGLGPVQSVLMTELRTLARRHPEGVEEASLKSAFIGNLRMLRETCGKPALEPKKYTGKFNETLASAIAAGHIDRLEDDLLVPRVARC